jgi:hypothetical protein
MIINLENSIIYDVEIFPNVFLLSVESLNSDFAETWEVSEFRDQREDMIKFFHYCISENVIMIGFNNIGFDYPILDFILRNQKAMVQEIYNKAMHIIDSENRFANVIWESNRFAPQLDLYKIHHMDNRAKSTSLKALQINMRSQSIVDMPVEVGTNLTERQIQELLIPYNKHDVSETKRFAQISMEAINFRMSLISQFGLDVLNFPDTKIGTKIMEKRLGDKLCFDRSTGRKQMRQTTRSRIALRDIIFPCIKFDNPEFKRVHEYLLNQVLKSDEIEAIGNEKTKLKTKGVFTDLKANVGCLDFHFGTGGIHGSVSSERIVATEEWLIRDIDVASLYPSIGIVNKLAPEHLGEKFTEIYSQLPQERKKWQKEKGKKCVEANTLKLAANGVYGNSNNEFSVFYDPQYTLTITVNGQLLLCMLAEMLVLVPTLQLIQINTDGITYYIHKDQEPIAAHICKEWQKYTGLVLEDVNYKRMWIRDVNSYIAEGMDGTLKLKGAYWTPEPLKYEESISICQPPAWHKDLGNVVSIRAAVAAMTEGIKPEDFIKNCQEPFDFMCRIKVNKSDNLFLNSQQIQKTSRYYVSTNGGEMVKSSPPTGTIGAFKKKNGVSDAEYNKIMTDSAGAWDERVCTKNKSKYELRETTIESGYKITLCNELKDFSFDNVDYEWYTKEANKLIIGV